MADIKFSEDEKSLLVSKLKRYFDAELDQELGQFDAEFLLDFISREIGAYYYNRGLADARVVVQSRLDQIDDAIYEIEKPTDLSR
ncbi:DUF2164 domain-containing protein [Pontibacterium granulatum]|uniref:DUF2164 domain-containing protein n=1 Tax=Pontibacterium granulatum TaxID=2036029 RepID=UPI00249CC02D|nr:DUF2164 domain-containing protein [Pontibacterium granulatum]MDI3326715.1 DUF2164 domain-containing protein [Pontibacterium granulatum]